MPRCGAVREVGAVFCALHLAAPSGTRGGWLSAERRRRGLGGGVTDDTPLDASNIVKRLWVGAQPPFDRDLPEFDSLVLCAQELQPPQLGFAKQVVRIPLPDSALSTDELRRALAGARHVAVALTNGSRVLVTCRAGLNRSAFVASLALGYVSRLPPQKIIDLVRKRRSESALSNSYFCEYITRFIGDVQEAKAQRARR